MRPMQDGNQARGMSAEEKLLRMQAILFVLTGCSHLYVHSPCTHQNHPYWMRIMWPSATPPLNQVAYDADRVIFLPSVCDVCTVTRRASLLPSTVPSSIPLTAASPWTTSSPMRRSSSGRPSSTTPQPRQTRVRVRRPHEYQDSDVEFDVAPLDTEFSLAYADPASNVLQ